MLNEWLILEMPYGQEEEGKKFIKQRNQELIKKINELKIISLKIEKKIIIWIPIIILVLLLRKKIYIIDYQYKNSKTTITEHISFDQFIFLMNYIKGVK